MGTRSVLFVVGLPASLSFLKKHSLGGLLVFAGQTLAGGAGLPGTKVRETRPGPGLI
jgi:hypothetical protein